MSVARQRIIDDTDPSIQYGSSGWFVADPQSLHVGNFGPIYQDTSHATSSSDSTAYIPFQCTASQWTHHFQGTSIRVYGTIWLSTVNNVTDPTWECFVDQIEIPNGNDKFQFPENNWELCSQPELTSGPHVLTIQVQSKGQKFYLDYLMYTPLPDASFETSVLLCDPTDPAVSFGNGWRTFGGENGTNDNGAQVSLSFQGTSVVPFGFVPHELPHNATWATYTIDNGSPVNFTLPGLSPSEDTTQYFASLFTMPTISSGPHDLLITYGGDGQHTPLMIGGFYVTNTNQTSADPFTFSSSSASSSASASPSTSPSSHHSTSAGAIAGGVIGGVIALFLLAAAAFFCQRRRHQNTSDPISATPFPMSGSNPNSPPLAVVAAPRNNPSSAVPGNSLNQSSGTSGGSGVYTTDTRPSTTYPYIHHAPLHHHPSDTMSSSRGTHTQQLSFSSASGSASAPISSAQQPNSSISAVVSHDSTHGRHGGNTMRSLPVQGMSSKLARERAAIDTLPSSVRANEDGTQFVQHQDSGVRLPARRVVDLPPGYSAE
ncbi:hypothetical protein R3P38DRAFT_3472327 [Favolaschia claudopus]|uniref:Epidermal growth factor receptor-like transmembrane-juxtamembrane segment domain-containing protein n=1 Tax=Favolaschia claudopus TaxID=2862362 RepID=A0AAV9ZAX7_9AGAR